MDGAHVVHAPFGEHVVLHESATGEVPQGGAVLALDVGVRDLRRLDAHPLRLVRGGELALRVESDAALADLAWDAGQAQHVDLEEPELG